MFLLLATLATAALGSLSLYAVFQRMSATAERLMREAPLLVPAQFTDGIYGRIEGRASSTEAPIACPGLAEPCLLYEMVVWASSTHNATHWQEVHREIVGVELSITVGTTVVRVDPGQVFLLDAPSRFVHRQLARGPVHGYPEIRTQVRYLLADARVQVAGLLTREVDQDPAATNDYREVATRFRMIGSRARPVVLAAASP